MKNTPKIHSTTNYARFIFPPDNEKIALCVGDVLQRLRPLIGIRIDRQLIGAVESVIRWCPRFESFRFQRKAAYQANKFVKCDERAKYLAIIDEVYNDHE